MIAKIRNVLIGENECIQIQSMTNFPALDMDANLMQCRLLYSMGCKIIRFATQRAAEIEAVAGYRKLLQLEFPDICIVADTHFSPVVAELAANVFDKVRINPGNFVDRNISTKIYSDDDFATERKKIEAQFIPFLKKCEKNNTAIRIGSNHGSLSERMMQKYGNTAVGMVESVLEFLEIAENAHFANLVISLKASSPLMMIEANRLLMSKMIENGFIYPLHLGVTEAGSGDEGRIKSAIGIGTLLLDGIGDTIRVSLTEPPENEINPAKYIIQAAGVESEKHQVFVSSKRLTAKIPYVVSRFKNGFERFPDYYFDQFRLTNQYGQSISDDIEIVIIDISMDLPTKIGSIKKQISDADEKKNMTDFLLHYRSDEPDWEKFLIYSAVHFGALFIDGFGDGIWIENENFSANNLVKLSYQILQAAGRRLSFPEIISCPGCGRTLFDLETVVSDVKKHLDIISNIKIAVMGCIVNGLGEMADADYGIVGAGKNRVNIFYQRKMVKQNILASQAMDAMLEILSRNNHLK
jgi:(E)-4-hydroxy-3-methylbut-2-enyl-diphosphate synthase